MPTLSQTKQYPRKSPLQLPQENQGTKVTGLTLNQQDDMKEKTLRLPLLPVCKMCFLYSSDKCHPCMENNMKDFTLKEDLTFEDIHIFPTKEFLNDLPANVRLSIIALYLEKIVDKLR